MNNSQPHSHSVNFFLEDTKRVILVLPKTTRSKTFNLYDFVVTDGYNFYYLNKDIVELNQDPLITLDKKTGSLKIKPVGAPPIVYILHFFAKALELDPLSIKWKLM